MIDKTEARRQRDVDKKTTDDIKLASLIQKENPIYIEKNKKLKFLLVEPAYNSEYAPLGLLKISTYLKSLGHDVTFVTGRRRELPEHFDEIYITTLFTFWYKITIETILFYKKKYPKANIKTGGIMASLMPEYIKRYTGVESHVGIVPEVENSIPDYSLTNAPASIVFTSRGCSRTCQWCIVPKVEGSVQKAYRWEDSIDPTLPEITFWDNNWFAKKYEDLENDVMLIKNFQRQGVRRIDFNQALDARLFTPKIANLIKDLPIIPLRFACDVAGLLPAVRKAILLAQDVGLMKKMNWYVSGTNNLVVYMLYNYTDGPEDFYNRCYGLCELGACVFPMRYQPLKNIKRDYLGPKWTKVNRSNVRHFANVTGMITCNSKHEFELLFGKDVNDFLERMNDPNFGLRRNKIQKQIKYGKASGVEEFLLKGERTVMDEDL